MGNNNQRMDNGATAGGRPGWDVEPLVEQIWSDLGGTITRPDIRREIEQVLPAFEDARIITYVPIFVRQRTVARLRTGSAGGRPPRLDLAARCARSG
jgi:hypothetical protein